MGTKTPSKPYPAELRERAVRLVREQEGEHASQAAAIRSIAEKVGCDRETLRLWVRQAERDRGQRAGLSTEERERLKALERENRARRQANEILGKASACLAQAELDRRSKPSTRRVDPVPPGSRCLWHRQGSRSSTSIAGSTGPSRSAGCCRSPRPPTTPMRPAVPTRASSQRG
jgi:transposase